MSRKFSFNVLIISVVVGLPTTLSSNQVFAQIRQTGAVHDHSHDSHAGHDHDEGAEHVHSGESLAFFLPEWKSMHFDDPNVAAQHAETVQKLGCEVKQDNHAGHIDVSYRCAAWRSLDIASHELADQWGQWLASSGFDVSHSHTDPVFAEGPEAVGFRMLEWKNLHGNGSPEETQFIEQLKRVGCEVRIDQHKDHSGFYFRAPTWRDIHLADHATAEQWVAWLKQNGFETKHSD